MILLLKVVVQKSEITDTAPLVSPTALPLGCSGQQEQVTLGPGAEDQAPGFVGEGAFESGSGG
jgi:hypothetical protein